MKRFMNFFCLSLVFCSFASLCSLGDVRAYAQTAAPPPGASGRVVSGEGKQETAISGATIALWALSTAKIGAPMVNLLPAGVVSDSNGYFAVGGLYTCPTPATLVYFVATGGSPGLAGGVQNPVIKLGTAIGPCSNLVPSSFVTINELTTIAVANSLYNAYAGPDSYRGWNPEYASKFADAFSLAMWLVNTATGQAPGTGLPTDLLVPTTELNTAADVLAACVRSDGNTQSPNTRCLVLTQNPGFGPPFTDTFQAAEYLAFFSSPSLFRTLGGGGPFQPTLTTLPAAWDFTLLATNATATPVITFSPGASSPVPQTVTLTDATGGATIYYAIGFSVYDAVSFHRYTGPFVVSGSATVTAYAIGLGNTVSGTANGSVIIPEYGTQLTTPVFSPSPGTYYGFAGQSFFVYAGSFPPFPYDSNYGGYCIAYTTDGSTPVAPPNSGPTCPTNQLALVSGTTTTVKAVAYNTRTPGYVTSPVATATYTIYEPQGSSPTFSPGGDTYASAQEVTIAAPGAVTIHYTTDGTKPDLNSPVYTGPISVTASETINALAAGAGGTNLAAAAASYTIAQPGNYGTVQSVAVRGLVAPAGVAVDPLGDLDIADTGNYRILQLTPGGAVRRLAGSISLGNLSGDGGPATAAGVQPFALATDPAGNLFFADPIDSRVREIAARTGIISTVAGITYESYLDGTDPGDTGDGGPATKARITVAGLAVDRVGNLYLAGRDRVRRIDAVTGIITTVAGGVLGFSGDGGPAVGAGLNNPSSLAFDAAGNLYIADTGNRRIRRVDAVTGTITTFAGQTSDPTFRGDGGPATKAYFDDTSNVNTVYSVTALGGLAFDPAGDLFLISSNTVREIDRAGVIRTVVGGGANAPKKGIGDGGYATDAVLNSPAALAFDQTGALYIADQGNNRVRKVVF